MLSFRTSSARAASLIAGAILHLGRRSESGSRMKCGVVGIGAPGRIRTCTVLLLREPPPAVGLLARVDLDNERMVPRQRVHARLRRAMGVDQTRGLPHTRRLLNQLSLQGKRSHQLSYAGMWGVHA